MRILSQLPTKILLDTQLIHTRARVIYSITHAHTQNNYYNIQRLDCIDSYVKGSLNAAIKMNIL